MLTDAVRHPQGLAIDKSEACSPFRLGRVSRRGAFPMLSGFAVGGVQGRLSLPWQGPASMEAERSEVYMTLGSLVSC